MTVSEIYHQRCLEHMVQLRDLYKQGDQNGWSWNKDFSDREEYLKQKQQLSNVTWFKTLSYEEQIEIAVHTQNRDFVSKLDKDQLAAYRIMI